MRRAEHLSSRLDSRLVSEHSAERGRDKVCLLHAFRVLFFLLRASSPPDAVFILTYALQNLFPAVYSRKCVTRFKKASSLSKPKCNAEFLIADERKSRKCASSRDAPPSCVESSRDEKRMQRNGMRCKSRRRDARRKRTVSKLSASFCGRTRLPIKTLKIKHYLNTK